ncbi:major facilitator superfamily MFS_1 [Stanieria cyanosphaera PCC 7437]|uniref:Major facilitator superfamily MFS_1 n=1 Tax=Stanieria cyanosphaera (strain ATCC 29371 / PCC 7437) TaxID=111780 RepID=K9Y0B9_STAC7|nr:MFS transporter [Stanieria cyanosphaera]AFZ37739.1 major facilitator superfamily MFS_1 [Stanieria cyanosphaera PCC 7437]
MDVGAATKLSKQDIRISLKASTYDGIFSAFFGCVTAEILLSNFLLELGANSLEIGMLSAIPMFAHFWQPLGAILAERSLSRRQYNLRIFVPARLLWLLLAMATIGFERGWCRSHRLIELTLVVVFLAHTFGALGIANWTSWMAVLVPRRLRGRYFGLRNSAANLTNLLSVPLLGLLVSRWQVSTVESYGLILTVAVVAGLISVSFQLLMTDVNPQQGTNTIKNDLQTPTFLTVFQDANFLKFLVFNSLWMFAVNSSAPFFNIYLLKDLGLALSWVTFYSSLTAGANVLMLVVWGKLADRIGNRSILIGIGMVVSILPWLWLGIDGEFLSTRFWLPLLYLFTGATVSAIDLCNNNLQMAIAPVHKPSSYFAIAAALGGLSGALGATTGGILAQTAYIGGLPGLFILSSCLRIIALLPLLFVREPRHESFVGFAMLRQVMVSLFLRQRIS